MQTQIPTLNDSQWQFKSKYLIVQIKRQLIVQGVADGIPRILRAILLTGKPELDHFINLAPP